MADRTPAQVEAGLNTALGTTTVHFWPQLPPRAPRWWQSRQRAVERRINRALASVDRGPIDDRMRHRYWAQARLGQCAREDAGGYFLRCWWAALGLPYRAFEESEADVVTRLLNAAGAKA